MFKQGQMMLASVASVKWNAALDDFRP